MVDVGRIPAIQWLVLGSSYVEEPRRSHQYNG